MEDCMIEHLITLMANIDFQEVHHIGEFLSRLRLMDPHEMRFAEQVCQSTCSLNKIRS